MAGEWKDPLKKCIIIPHRYILGIMGFLAVVNAYTMRICLSVAITEMVLSKDEDRFSPIIDKSEVYEWTEEQQGLILGSFYWGYIITHLPGGILAEKFGGKYTLGLGILSTALFTLVTPPVVWCGGWKGLVVLRVVEGLGEGTTYPALNVLLAQWVPLSERGKIGSIVYAGSQIGTVAGNLACGFIIEQTGTWSSVFYVFGFIGLLWFLTWQLLCYSRPATHPFIGDKELEYLNTELVGLSKTSRGMPWVGILTSLPVWALAAAQIGHDWGFYTMVSDLPKYMKDILKMTVSRNGIWTSVPYMVMWAVSVMSGYLCDLLINKKYFSVTLARKFFTTLAAVIPGILIIAASYAGEHEALVIFFFTAAMGFMGPYYCGMRVNGIDLASNYAGTIMAIVNGIGAITGIITPYLVGVIVTEGGDRLKKWRTIFWITMGVFLVTSLIYIIFGSGKEQWYNDPERYKEIRDAKKATRAEKKEAKRAQKAAKREERRNAA